MSADDHRIATAGCDAAVRLWDTTSGGLVREFAGHRQPIDQLAISPDGRQILTGAFDHTVLLWDAETGQSQQLVDYRGSIGVAGVAISADGRYGVSASWAGDHSLNLFDLATGRQVWQIIDPVRSTGPVALSPDGRLVAHRGDRESLAKIIVRRTDAGEVVKEIAWPTWALQGEIAFSPDGAYLAGSGDRVIDLWNIEQPDDHRQLVGHTDQVRALAFSADGSYLVSGSLDGTARLWDLATGKEIRRFVASNAGFVNGVAMSHDGSYLYTVHDDGWLRMWDLDYDTTVRRLCARLLRDFTPEEREQYDIAEGATCPTT